MMRRHVVQAVFKRNVGSYFSGVLGYLFIVVFVVVGAFAAFNTQFFTNNLANLDQLSAYYPMLLLFIIPAVTMTAWAEEKKQGTDELLFTLPASDFEILIGKYLAVLAVYTVALFFSLTYLGVLEYYADPDWGLLCTTFLGYWLAGAALLSAGMFASALTSSVTVAFVLGTAICAIPVFIGDIPTSTALGESFLPERLFERLSLAENLREFGMGVIPLTSVLYFVSLTALMLYLNLVVISKRHWSSGREGSAMGLQFAVRTICLAAILFSFNVVISKAGDMLNLRLDMTAEKIYTLTETTRNVINRIDEKRPVTIQVFMSPEVPREFVTQRSSLQGLLRQYDRLGGGGIEVRFVDVEPFSVQAEEAKQFGINARQVPSERDGRFRMDEIYLGAVVTSPYDEVVIPFFEAGASTEYELTRSIRTVSNEERLTVGVLSTDARVNGGMNMSTFRNAPSWQIKAELKKQYNVEDVSADMPIDAGKYDVLLAVMPSSLTQPQMANLVDYVQAGNPTLIFDDPLPVFDGGQSAPSQPKPKQGGMFGQGPPPEQKADGGRATSLLNVLEISWNNDEVAWDTFNPHPQLADAVRPELIFVSPKNGPTSAFNQTSDITSGLQEVLLFFPGTVRPRRGSNMNFEPLMRTGPNSGLLGWNQIVEPGFFGGISINPNPRRFPDTEFHVLAAHITSEKQGDKPGINVVFVADVDIISDQLFAISQGELHELKLDNVKFVLNAVDRLAGDTSYIELRKRRPEHRILTRIQQRTETFRDARTAEEEKAEKDADEQLAKARERLSKQREEIENDSSLSSAEKAQQLEIARQNEQRKLEVAEANIEREKKAKIEQIKAREQRQIRDLEGSIRWKAVVFPPIPALLLGIIVLSSRLYTERRDIEASRMIRK